MNKYGANKIHVDGMTFDSKAEYRRWCELKLLERTGEITELKRQVPFEIVPKYRYQTGEIQRALHYIADFTYKENGRLVVEDVKGCTQGAAYDLFKTKIIMLGWLHDGLKVREINYGNKRSNMGHVSGVRSCDRVRKREKSGAEKGDV